MPFQTAPARRPVSLFWRYFVRGSKRRRSAAAPRDQERWNVAAEVLEERTLLAAPTLDWGVSLGTTSGSSTVNSTAVDSSGDIYIAGVVTRGTVDLDPGSGTANVTADIQTGFVAKYDTAGQFLWVETFASDASVSSFSLTVDATGGVYVAGAFRGTTRFGVGESNPATLANQGGQSANGFVAKLDQTTGHVDWVDGVLGNLSLATNNVAVDSTGRVFIAGQSGSGTITITDGETGTVLQTFSSSSSNYVARLDSNGGVTWAEGFADGKAAIVAGSGLAVDTAGDVYLTGALLGKDVDFDPGAGSFMLSRTACTSNTFVAKLDVAGNFVWATKDDATGFAGTSGSSIAVDSSGNAYLTMQQTGGGWGCGRGWGGSGYSDAQQQLAKVDSSGNWQWTRTLTSANRDHSDCGDPPSCGGWHDQTPPDDNCQTVSDDNSDHWSHGSGNSNPTWTSPVDHVDEWHQGSHAGHYSSRTRTLSRSTAKVALDNTGNPIVVSASSGAAAYSSSGDIVWSTTTPMPVTDITVDSSGNIIFVGMFNNQLNVSPDGTYLLDSNLAWRRLAPFLVRWKTS